MQHSHNAPHAVHGSAQELNRRLHPSLTKRIPFGFRLSFLQDRRRMRVHTCMLYTVRPMFRADEADVRAGVVRGW